MVSGGYGGKQQGSSNGGHSLGSNTPWAVGPANFSSVYGAFDDLVRGNRDLSNEQEVEWYWDEYEAPYRQSGNKSTRNVIIGGMNAVNLVVSFKIMQGWLLEILPGIPMDTASLATIFLGYVPFVFSLIFFLVPGVRYFQNKKKNNKIHLNNIRKRLMKVVFQSPNGIVQEEANVDFIDVRAGI